MTTGYLKLIEKKQPSKKIKAENSNKISIVIYAWTTQLPSWVSHDASTRQVLFKVKIFSFYFKKLFSYFIGRYYEPIILIEVIVWSFQFLSEYFPFPPQSLYYN